METHLSSSWISDSKALLQVRSSKKPGASAGPGEALLQGLSQAGERFNMIQPSEIDEHLDLTMEN